MKTAIADLKAFGLLFIIMITITTAGHTQAKITFKVNLTPQLEDSVFVPDRDNIYLKGDVFPLTNSRKVYLEDLAPADSIYEATVNFPPSANGEHLTYNFFIESSEREMTEEMPRQLKIASDDKELNVLYFNSFAW